VTEARHRFGKANGNGPLHLIPQPFSAGVSLCGRSCRSVYQTAFGVECRRCRRLASQEDASGRPHQPVTVGRRTTGGCPTRKTYLAYERQARERGLPFALTQEQFVSITQLSCAYCGASPANVTRHGGKEFRYNGIDRVDNTKGYVEGNVAPCCGACNLMKGSRTRDEFIRHIMRISAHYAEVPDRD
jgi:hypothetical protein